MQQGASALREGDGNIKCRNGKRLSSFIGLGLGPIEIATETFDLKASDRKNKNIKNAVSVDRTRDLQIFSLTLSQLSYPRNLVMEVIQTLEPLEKDLSLSTDPML
jgi:hypothetical protein